MADTITDFEVFELSDILANRSFWEQYPLMKNLIAEKGSRGLKVIHMDLNVATSTVTTATETTDPTNVVHNVAAPEQIYVQSDDGADAGKTIKWYGQKADGTLGWYTATATALSQGYQQFTAVTAPVITSGDFTFKLTVDGVAFNGAADITVALLDTDTTLAAIATKIDAALDLISNTTATSVGSDGLIRITSNTNDSTSVILIAAPGAGDSLITLLTAVGTAVDGTDATTKFDAGTWNFISFVEKIDAWAGNVVIDDDGASGTVYWTSALGVNATDGILVTPVGYSGALLIGSASLLTVPAAGDAMGLDIADTWIDFMELYSPRSNIGTYRHISIAGARVPIKTFFIANPATTNIELYYVIWEN